MWLRADEEEIGIAIKMAIPDFKKALKEIYKARGSNYGDFRVCLPKGTGEIFLIRQSTELNLTELNNE
jgi:hypothetical protein